MLLLADSLLQQGEEQRVIDLLEPRAASFPDDLAFGYLLGTALVRTGQRDRGQVYMDRIFKAGESAEARLLMGTALIQTKDYPAAVVEFKKAVELNPQLPTARTMYGRALMAVGDTDAASREFLRALQVNPNDFDANLQLGALRKRDQQNDEARDLPGAGRPAASQGPDRAIRSGRCRDGAQPKRAGQSACSSRSWSTSPTTKRRTSCWRRATSG